MNNKDISILTTWDNEIINVDINIEKWLQLKSEAKSKGEDGIYIQKLQRFIKFSNLKDETGKTLYIALPEPKKEFKELTPQERKDRDVMIK